MSIFFKQVPVLFSWSWLVFGSSTGHCGFPTRHYLPLVLSCHFNFMVVNVRIWLLSNPVTFSNPRPSSDLLTMKTESSRPTFAVVLTGVIQDS